jgi:hypothetical protein
MKCSTNWNPRRGKSVERRAREKGSGESEDSHEAGSIPGDSTLRREMGAIRARFWVLYDSICENAIFHNINALNYLRIISFP